MTAAKRKGRQATGQELLAALDRLLVREGFGAVGVNAVAREAGVDKVLIYRYFGGLPELLTAYGRRSDLWPDLEELAAGDPAGFARLPARDKACLLARNLVEGLRARPATREILVWELVERNVLTRELAAVRERTAREALDLLRPSPGEAALDVDVEAALAVLSSSASYLAAVSRGQGVYAGVEISEEAGWERIRRAMDGMLLGLMSFGG